MDQVLVGKVAVVTGATGGIGRAICSRLAKDGADIALLYSSRQESAVALCNELRALGITAVQYQCNVADYNEVEAVFQNIRKDFGKIDILVNNAGITRDKLLIAMKPGDFNEVLDVNLKGVYHTTKQVTPMMLKARTGKIINISSVAGMNGNAGQTNYAASKAGVIGLTKSLAKELASRGICCNAIAPGFVTTDMTAAYADNEKVLAAIPMHRFAKPEEIAELVFFLASPMSDYITGEVIKIDGGLAI